MNIQQYITSGALENYALGLASDRDAAELERLLSHHAELRIALTEFELQLELFAMRNRVPPPPDLRERIADRLRKLPAVRPSHGGKGNGPGSAKRRAGGEKGLEYIPVQVSSPYIRVHKHWRTAFIVIFILSKLLLAASIYYFVQYQHAQKDLQRFKRGRSAGPGENTRDIQDRR